MSDGRPLPRVTGESEPFWAGCARQQLRLQRCESCAAWLFPPGAVCRSCASTELQWHDVSGLGKVHSFTVVHRTPIRAFAADVPYTLGLVELDEGVRLLARLEIETSEPRIGSRVAVAFHAVTDDVTLPVFREVST